MAGDPTLLRPTAELAGRAVLCADPAAALALAQVLTERPLMFNHAHGLWGYTGRAEDGEPLTVQATGVGGPCAALVLRDLAALGLRVAVRVGPAGGGPPGALVAVEAADGQDGASRALGGARPPDPALTAALAARADGTATIVSRDVPSDDGDLETAALLAAAGRDGVRLACGVVRAGGLDDDGLRAAKERAGRAALGALLEAA